MRTTLTLDDDLADTLKEIAFSKQKSMKQVVNDALRAGLRASAAPPPAQSYRLQPASLGSVAPGLDLHRALRLADELEDEGLVSKLEARK